MHLPLKAAALFLSAALSGFIGSAEASPEPEKDAALDAYLQCIRDAAPRLDDGVSDVVGVALAVMAKCNPQSDRIVER
jgi:hypothetical protein